MSDTESAGFFLDWLLNPNALVLTVFYVTTISFFGYAVRSAWQRHSMHSTVLSLGAIFLLLPSWAALFIALYEVFGSHRGYYVVVALIHVWIGVAINMMSTILVPIARFRARSRLQPAT